MERIREVKYGAILLRNIVSDAPQDWDIGEATHVRVSLPADLSCQLKMQQMGYQFVDRMLDVSVHLNKLSVDFQKSIRIKPVLTTGYKKEICQIAEKSFTTDRRFHVEVSWNQDIAKQIIDAWVEELTECYVCLYKEEVIGFLALKEEADHSAAVHLAAVEERYRASGAALSLYANALKEGREKGYRNITGCISTANLAVMNLYASLGGTFSNPRDIYLRK